MTRSWGKALWGYRKKTTDVFIEHLEAQVATREQEREAELEHRKKNVQTQMEAVQAAEAALKALQAEYFHLSGELTALTLRSQQTLEEAASEFRRQEDLVQEAVQARRHYVESLSDTIRAVPDEIRGVIERIAEPMTRPPAANPPSANTMASTPHPSTVKPGEESSG
ncbi:MAG: hypothetical protein C7B45_06185 [Sulfobacillus acidophilus]|uniref:Uncharacterized protein n=1 Tax=Sulfobacillus acidophilus TaxID=53633 RepID=A0A2T2WK67_9FIRM|nr:MAG: hypothetical protein C7B45_06185 [Sulfobacillus acidophilus]